MKTFVINLAREPHKKSHIIQECAKYSLDIDIIEAVDGKALTEEYLKKSIYNYPDCKLTKGEIGCSMSHLNIYQKMQDENIPIALILEDDAIFMNDPRPLLYKIEQNENSKSKNVYLLSGCYGSYFPHEKLEIENYSFYKTYEAFLTHGYVITLTAAKKILKLQKDIKFEADQWYYFELFGCTNVFCLIPLLIDNNDKSKVNSTIEQDRSTPLRYSERHNLRRKLCNKNVFLLLKRKLLKFKIKNNKLEKRNDGINILL